MLLRWQKSRQLIKSLRNPDGHVRLDAVRSLGELKAACAVEPLIEALADAEDYVRWNAAEALGKIGDLRSVSPLIQLLQDMNPLVRKEALKALRLFSDQRAIKAVQKYEMDKVKIALEKLASYPLSSPGRLEAIRFLHQSLDLRAVEPLIGILTDKRIDPAKVGLHDDDVLLAIEALGDSKDSRAVPPLLQVLTDHLNNENILRDGISRGYSPESIKRTTNDLNEDDPNNTYRVREMNAAWLQSIPPLYLQSYRKRPACASRAIACVKALVKISSEPKILDLIVHCLNDDNVVLREAAITGVVLLSERTSSWEWLAKSLSAEILEKVGKRAIEPLIAMLLHNDSGIRRGCALALGHFDEPEVLSALFRARKDVDAQVRAAAASALVEICSRTPHSIIDILENPDADIKWAAAKVLGRAHIADATESLIRLLRDEHSNVRSVAAKALGQICDGKAIETLTEAVADSDENVRREAVKSIDKIVAALEPGSPDAVECFTRLLKDQRANVRSVAAKALGQLIATQAVEQLAQVAMDVDQSVRRETMQALDNIVKAVKSEIDKVQKKYDALLGKRELLEFYLEKKEGLMFAYETLRKWHRDIPYALEEWAKYMTERIASPVVGFCPSKMIGREFELQRMTAIALLKGGMKKDIKIRIYLHHFANLDFHSGIEGLPIDRKVDTYTRITFQIDGEELKEFTNGHYGSTIEVLFKSDEMKTQQAKVIMLQEQLTSINALTSRVSHCADMDGSP